VLDHLEKLVDPLNVGRVHEGAVRILSEVGMAVPSEEVCARLAGAGLRIAKGRMFVAPQRTIEFMEGQRCRMPPEPPLDFARGGEPVEPQEAPVRLHSGSHALHHLDPEAGVAKPLTIPDLERYTRLLAALQQNGMLASACCPGQPGDVEPGLAPLWQQLISARFIPDPPIYAYSLADAPYVAEMARILGKGITAGVHPISPLLLAGEEFELALRLIDDGAMQEVSAAPMPVMGVTAPLDWAAGWAQAVAEAVGAAIALEALGARRAHAFAALYTADMHTGGLVYGSPEHALITLTEAKVNRELLGNPRRAAKSLMTTAKVPDEQAAAEKTAHTLIALLGGYRELGGVGILAVDEVFSPQQIFIDFDIVGHVWHMVRGLQGSHAQGDVVALLGEGVFEGERFLGAESTLRRFRDFYWSPRLFDRRPTKAWLADPTDVLERAWELGKELIGKYDYELDAGRQKALREVIESARNSVCA
jgi:trimethylamine:corrinoid methyltransferase-like protein